MPPRENEKKAPQPPHDHHQIDPSRMPVLVTEPLANLAMDPWKKRKLHVDVTRGVGSFVDLWTENVAVSFGEVPRHHEPRGLPPAVGSLKRRRRNVDQPDCKAERQQNQQRLPPIHGPKGATVPEMAPTHTRRSQWKETV